MAPFFASPDITAFVGVRRTGTFFEGFVNILQGTNSSRIQHTCLGSRDSKHEALLDARTDAMALIRMWRQKVAIR